MHSRKTNNQGRNHQRHNGGAAGEGGKKVDFHATLLVFFIISPRTVVHIGVTYSAVCALAIQ